MKLLTKAQREKLIRNHSENLFNPVGIGTWYLTELNPYTEIAFGLCELAEKEIGYVSLTELEELRLPMGLKIERDRYSKIDKTLEELL
jgi:hypothetical protein